MSFSSLLIAATILSPLYLAILRQPLPDWGARAYFSLWVAGAILSGAFFAGALGHLASGMLVSSLPEFAASIYLPADLMIRAGYSSVPVLVIVAFAWRFLGKR